MILEISVIVKLSVRAFGARNRGQQHSVFRNIFKAALCIYLVVIRLFNGSGAYREISGDIGIANLSTKLFDRIGTPGVEFHGEIV